MMLRRRSSFLWLVACVAAPLPAQFVQFEIRQHTGSQNREFRGESVLGLGDIDRDGVEDYLVGGSRFTTTLGAVGRIDAHSGATGAPLYSVLGQSRDMRLGFSLARTNDHNGDGFDDWIAGAPFESSRATNAGRVMCFSGRTGALIWQVFGTVPNQLFGWSMTSVGRAGAASGAHDVVVGAPGDGVATSSFSVLAGGSGMLITRVDAPARHRLGTSMAVDGRRLAVGAPGSGPNSEGSVRFFEYQSPSLVEFQPYLSFDANAGIGASITRIVRPSGTRFAIGGAGTASVRGRVDVVRVTPTFSVRETSLFGFGAGDQFGFSVASGADADADGVEDLLVGAPGISWFWFFRGSNLTQFGGAAAPGEGAYGWAVRFLSDINGDGLAELAIGAPLANTPIAANTGRLHIFSVMTQGSSSAYGTNCGAGSVSVPFPLQLRPGGFIGLEANLGPTARGGVWMLGLDRLSVDLGILGMPGCFLHTTPILTQSFAAPSTLASLTLPIPMDPSVARATLRAQFATLDPGANPAGVVTSNGLELEFGNR